MDGATVHNIGDGPSGGEFPTIIIDPTDGDGTGIPTIDPVTATGETEGTGDGPKRRGRPRGSKNFSSGKQPQKEVSQDLGSLLLTTHFFLAKLTKIEELKLEEEEAAELGKALARIQKEFGVAVISPKMAAIINLGIVAGGVYGTRFMAYNLNHKKEEKPKIVAMPSAPNMMM